VVGAQLVQLLQSFSSPRRRSWLQRFLYSWRFRSDHKSQAPSLIRNFVALVPSESTISALALALVSKFRLDLRSCFSVLLNIYNKVEVIANHNWKDVHINCLEEIF
jgi:hypothetical protein